MKTDKEILYDWAKEKNINRKECIHAHYEWWALIEFSKYHQQQVKSYDSLDSVRISCFKEVFEKFQEIEHESDFYGWLHAKSHEA
jgi:hypothetical protein